MFYVYVLKSLKNETFYIGYTSNLQNRLARHQQGRSKYTKTILPVELVYSEEFASKTEALRREKELKNMKSHQYIYKLING